MKKILVTGGAGFLGSHLCDRLIAQGHQVIALDSLFTGSKKNIAGLASNPNFKFVQHDVVDPITVQTLGVSGLDEIYNLACPASPVHYQYDPIHTMKTSVLGALNMLELARNTGAKVFQASTSEVYGDPSVHPQPEEYWGNVNTIGIRSCYDEGKRAAETLWFDYQRAYNLRIKVVRIFNTYGPRMAADDGRVVSNFIVQALRGEDLTIYGDGMNVRDWLYVEDHCRGIEAALLRGRPGETYNIGGGEELPNMAVIDRICAEVDRAFAEIDGLAERYPDAPAAKGRATAELKTFVEDRRGHDRRYAIDETKARSELGYVPKHDFETGLRGTLRWYLDHEDWWRPLLAA